MKLKSTNIKNFIQWLLAIAVAFALANILILPYWYTPGWVSRDHGATPAIYHGSQIVINGYEGYGYATVDSRGYLNEDKPLADEVVLVLGCSHTKGIEVPMGQRYTDLLNDKLSNGDDSKLYVYNMAIDGFYFPQIAQGFGAAMQEIPSVKSVVIEIPTTEYSPDDFVGLTTPRQYSADFTGTTAFYNVGRKAKLQVLLKEALPLASLYLSKQFVFEESAKTPFLFNGSVNEKAPFPLNAKEAYQIAVDQAFQYIRSNWDGELIVYYHPKVQLLEDGSLTFIDSITTPWFAEASSKYDVKIIGAGGEWLSAYETDYTVPYGFANTTLGVGHLNADGHRISAELIYKYMEGEAQQ